MPRPPAAYRDVLDAARTLEPGLAASIRKGLTKARDSVSINGLAMALAARDPKRALSLLPAAAVKDALAPAGTRVREAFAKGGRVGAERIRKAVRA